MVLGIALIIALGIIGGLIVSYRCYCTRQDRAADAAWFAEEEAWWKALRAP